MKVKSESEVAQLCPTLHNPMNCSLPGSFIHGILQARVLEWDAIAFSYFNIKLVLMQPDPCLQGLTVPRSWGDKTSQISQLLFG